MDIVCGIYKDPYYIIDYTLESKTNTAIVNKDISDMGVQWDILERELQYHTKVFIQDYLFNHNLSYLPQHITHIIFNSYSTFNKPIDIFPINLIYLTLGDKFNQSLDNLPATLEYLELGNAFNHPLDNLPPNIKYLRIGELFNHPLDNLPCSLIHLEFGYKAIFNRELNNLPSSLEHLVIGNHSKFDQPLDNLPKGLKILYMGVWHSFTHTLNNLPDSIEQLYLFDNISGLYMSEPGYNQIITKLPKNIKYARIFRKYKKYDELKEIYKDILD